MPINYVQVAYDFGKLEQYYKRNKKDVGSDISLDDIVEENDNEFPEELWFREGVGLCQGALFAFGEYFKRQAHYDRGEFKMDALQSEKAFALQIIKNNKGKPVDTEMIFLGIENIMCHL